VTNIELSGVYMKNIILVLSLTWFFISCNGVNSPLSGLLSKTYSDPTNDVIEDHIDIMSCHIDLNGDDITIDFTLENVPASLTFNHSALADNYLEYEYEVEFDSDLNGTPNYSISVMHFKPPGSSEIISDLISNTQANLWEDNGSSSSTIGASSSSLIGNVLTITTSKSLAPALSNLMIDHVFGISTFYTDGTTSYVDGVSL